MELIYEWTDERDEEDVRDRTFHVEFEVTDWGFAGDHMDPPYGPEIEIKDIREDTGAQSLQPIDKATYDLLAGSDHLHEAMIEYAESER